MHWLNNHPAGNDEPRFVYRCTRDDCDWKSPALFAMISAEIVQELRHPEHRVRLDEGS